MRISFAAALMAGLLLALPLAADAHEYKLGDLEIVHPWARASAGNAKNGTAYMTIKNHGDSADRLLAVTSPAAAVAELHTHIMEDNVMKMRPVEAIELAPGGTEELAPGGLHIMLMGLTETLVEGEGFAMTLTFERAGTLEVTVLVASVATVHSPHGANDAGQ